MSVDQKTTNQEPKSLIFLKGLFLLILSMVATVKSKISLKDPSFSNQKLTTTHKSVIEYLMKDILVLDE